MNTTYCPNPLNLPPQKSNILYQCFKLYWIKISSKWVLTRLFTHQRVSSSSCCMHTPAYSWPSRLCKVFMLLHYVAPLCCLHCWRRVCIFRSRGFPVTRRRKRVERLRCCNAALLLLLLILLLHMNTYISASLRNFWLVMSWNCTSTHTNTLLGCNKDLFTNQCCHPAEADNVDQVSLDKKN